MARAGRDGAAALQLAAADAQAPRGDGHPVLLLPGFMADEGSLSALKLVPGRARLRRADLGLRAATSASSAAMRRRWSRRSATCTTAAAARVSLVGWSLGGVFALYGALQAPECVRQVVTLGSPVSVDDEGSQSPAAGEGAVPHGGPPAWAPRCT
jgi:pimeloyl-ACP methyl ester carboxylesterase